MRIHHLMVACLALAGCKQASRSAEAVATPARSDKLVRAAEPVPGSYLVTLVDGLGEGDAGALAARHGATLTGYLPAPVNAALVTLDPSKAIALAEDEAVKLAEEDQVLRVASIDWNLDRIDQRATAGDGAYAHATSGSGVTIYVLDSGVMATHPEVAGRASLVADFVHRAPSAVDCNGHGTHLAGVVAGTDVGVAPAATIAAVRVASCDGTAEASDLAEAIDWVRQHRTAPAVVLIGPTGGPSSVLANAIDALVESGAAVVGPAGNEGGDACSTALGGVPAVITVGATSAMDLPLASSNRGRCVDLYAPGAAIRSGWSDGGYRLADGTSQAAAHVAGAAALFLEARADATPAQVAAALVGNATVGAVSGVPLGSPDRLLYTGFVDPALGSDSTAPEVAIEAPSEGSTLSGEVVVSIASGSPDVASIAVYVDGNWVGSDADADDGLTVSWPTVPYVNGEHVVEARAYDAAGNVGVAQVTVTVENAGNASWDPTLQAPACAAAGERCSSGALLEGRGPAGPEANAPNTIQSLCADGAAGSHLTDESVEAIAVQAAIPGHPLAEGDLVDVAVTVWGYPDYANDRVDLHFASDAGAPDWSYAGSAAIPGPGLQTVHFTYRLPAFPDAPARPQQAVRATVRYGGAPAVCSDGPYDDHDDLAFVVVAGTPDTQRPSVAIVAPSTGAEISGEVNLDASAADAGGGAIGRVELYVGGALVGTSFQPITRSVYRVAWQSDALPLGEYPVVAVAYDASGNWTQSEPITIVLKDLSPPTVAIEDPLPGAAVGGTVRLWADATDNRGVTKVELRIGSQVVGTALTPPWAVDWDSTSTSGGSVTFEARAYDGHNTATSAPVTVRVDNEAPGVWVDQPAKDAVLQGVVRVEIGASDNDAIDHVDLFAGDAFVDTATWDDGVGAWVVDWNTGLLANGPVALTARAYDEAGNAATSAPVVVVVNDTTPPVAAFVEPAAGALLHGAVDVGATASDNGVVTHVRFVAGTSLIGEDPHAPYAVSWDTSALPDGPVTLTATAYDLAGLTGVATRTVRVDNHGPVMTVAPPVGPAVSGTITVTATATDRYGVDRVELYAGDELLGEMTVVTATTLASGFTGSYAFTWDTTASDNELFSLRAVAVDLVGNVSQSAVVAFDVSNVTTAERDATLGVPACASSAAWCWSGTLLRGAGSFEEQAPNTLATPACVDGALGAHHQSESVESIRVATSDGSLAPGAVVTVTVRYWAPVANEADQVDVYLAADALDPAWAYLGTLTPTLVGLNEGALTATLPTGPLQAVRANFRFAQPGPSACSGGDFGDRDDLVFAVGSPSDTTAPAVTLDAPADGAVVGGDFVLMATASDDQGIAKVEFLVDGVAAITLLQPDPDDGTRYSAVWPTLLVADGAHDVAVRAQDTSGNVTTTAAVAVGVDNALEAAFDADWGVPVCGAVASFCDSAELLDGRGGVGPELNEPNTLGGSCADGPAGVYHQDESLDWLRVSSVDGLPLEPGKRARVDAGVWSYDSWGGDSLDLYYTSSPLDPHWIYLATLASSGPGATVLSAEYVIPPGGMQAIRGRYRYGGTAGACGSGSFDDHDDLAFAVQYTANAVYDKKLGVPVCATVAGWCDSGALLDGRAGLGPEENAPNTLDGACADGTVGSYHSDPSVDAILVRTDDLSPLAAGGTARIEVTTWASASWWTERVDLYTCADPSATTPTWVWAGRLLPTREGAQVLVGTIPVTAGAQAVRAHLWRWSLGVTEAACGTSSDTGVIDDQDDLVFTAE